MHNNNNNNNKKNYVDNDAQICNSCFSLVLEEIYVTKHALVIIVFFNLRICKVVF